MSVQIEQKSSKFQLRLIWSRMKRSARFDSQSVLELRDDRGATGQSIGVLFLGGLFYGVGAAFLTGFRSNSISAYSIIVGSMAGLVSVCFAGFVWAATVFLVGTKLFQGKTGFWELARPLFFSASPFLLFILISIPIYALQATVTVVAAVWVVLLQGFALKQVMGFSFQRTLLTAAVGLLILAFIGLQFGSA